MDKLKKIKKDKISSRKNQFITKDFKHNISIKVKFIDI